MKRAKREGKLNQWRERKSTRKSVIISLNQSTALYKHNRPEFAVDSSIQASYIPEYNDLKNYNKFQDGYFKSKAKLKMLKEMEEVMSAIANSIRKKKGRFLGFPA
jgi:hypothetical protein